MDHDAEIAAMAKFALAGELAKSGKTPEAAKLYQDLVDHPTMTVPKASALLAMADAYRESQPARRARFTSEWKRNLPPMLAWRRPSSRTLPA